MLKDGCFDRFFKPEYSLALHVDANLPAGWVGNGPVYVGQCR